MNYDIIVVVSLTSTGEVSAFYYQKDDTLPAPISFSDYPLPK